MMRMRTLVGGFGWLFGLGIVALVARYGYIGTDNPVNGAILAFLFAGLAAAGLFGHAVAVRIWQIHRAWSVVLGLICFAALALNISNSLGAIAGRDDKAIAERTKTQETRADTRAELSRLVARRDAIPTTTATDASVRAAEAALATAQQNKVAACKRRTEECAERETELQAKQDALTKAVGDRDAAKLAAQLDADIKRLRDRLDAGQVVRSANPQGAIFAKLFRLPDSEADAAATWQQFAISIMVDLVIVGCFIAYEVLGWTPRAAAARTETPAAPEAPAMSATVVPAEPVEVLPPLRIEKAKPVLVASTIRVADALDRLKIGGRSRLELAVARQLYVAECRRRGCDPVDGTTFADEVLPWCQKNGVRLEEIDGCVYLVGVRLIA